jgi:predicted enzyme related to lactoylglutathione lyase
VTYPRVAQLVFAVENLGRSVDFYEQAFGWSTAPPRLGDRLT